MRGKLTRNEKKNAEMFHFHILPCTYTGSRIFKRVDSLHNFTSVYIPRLLNDSTVCVLGFLFQLSLLSECLRTRSTNEERGEGAEKGNERKALTIDRSNGCVQTALCRCWLVLSARGANDAK